MTLMLKPYRGVVAKWDALNLGNVLGFLMITILLCFIVGTQVHWALSIVFILVYLLHSAFSIWLVRRKSNKYLRQSHFLLATICRAENNKFYLAREVRLRPGYLAKWVEFKIINKEQEERERLDRELVERLQKEEFDREN